MEYFYKHRYLQGYIKYEVLERNENFAILKDTSCRDHENCVIKVVPSEDGSYYIFAEPMNESAKTYRDYHEGEWFFDTFEKCKSDNVSRLKQSYDLRIEECKDRIASYKDELAKAKPKKTSLTTELRIGDTVYYDDNGRMESSRVKFKVVGEDGNTAWWIDEDGNEITRETSDRWYYNGRRFVSGDVRHLSIRVEHYDLCSEYSSTDYRHCDAFATKKEYEDFDNMLKAYALFEKIENAEKRLNSLINERNKLDEK